jgi:hypothetical protein
MQETMNVETFQPLCLSSLPAELSGLTFEMDGDAAVEGGEVGCSESIVASKLNAFA